MKKDFHKLFIDHKKVKSLYKKYGKQIFDSNFIPIEVNEILTDKYSFLQCTNCNKVKPISEIQGEDEFCKWLCNSCIAEEDEATMFLCEHCNRYAYITYNTEKYINCVCSDCSIELKDSDLFSQKCSNF